MPFDPKKYGAKEVKTQSGVDLSKYGATEVPETPQAPQPEKKKASFGALGDLLFRAAQVGAEVKKQKPLLQLEQAYERKKAAEVNAPLTIIDPERYKAPLDAEAKSAEDELRVQRNLLKPFLNQVAISAEKSWRSFSDDGVPDYENIFKTAGQLAEQFGGGDNAKEELANTIIQSVKSGAIRQKADEKFKTKTGFDVNEYISRQQQKEGGATEDDRRFIEEVYKSGIEEVVNEEQQTKEAVSAAMPLLQKTGASFLSALQSGIASQGTALATQYGVSNKVTDWLRGFKTGAEQMEVPQKEWTLENIKSDPAGTIIPFVAQQAGASLPSMVGGIATGLATGSGPAGAIVSLLGEKLANTGDTYEQLIAQGVPVDEAKRRSAELMKPMITDALNFIEMDLLLKAAKGRGSMALNAIGSGLTEVPAEYQQQYEQEKALNPELTVKQFMEKTGATLGVQTFVSSALMGGAVGVSGKVANVVANKIPNSIRQRLQSAIQKEGPEKAKEIIAAQAEDGVLTEAEIQDLQDQVDEIAQADQALEQMGVAPEVRQAATTLSTQINEINQRVLTETNPAVISKLTQERQKLQSEMDGIISGQKGFVAITTEGGGTFTIPEAQAQEVITDLKDEIEAGSVEAKPIGEIKVEIPKRRLPKVEGLPARRLPKVEGVEPVQPTLVQEEVVQPTPEVSAEAQEGTVSDPLRDVESTEVALKEKKSDLYKIPHEIRQEISIEDINKIPKGGLHRSDESQAELVRDIQKNGINEPIVIVYNVKDNSLRLQEGHHRIDAANKLGIKKIPAKIQVEWDRGTPKEFPIYNPPTRLNVEGYKKRNYEPSNINIEEIGFKTKEKDIAEAYHKAKSDGTNPELVKAVEDVLKQPTPAANQPVSEVTTKSTPKAKEGVTEEVQPSPVSVGQGEAKGTAAVLTPEQEAEIDAAQKPEIPLTLIPSAMLTGKEIQIEAVLAGTNKKVTWEGTDVERHNEIKDEYKKLRKILDCIG